MLENKINKALILLATELEGQPWCSGLGPPQSSHGPLKFFTGKAFDVLITGMGPVACSYSCGWMARFQHAQWLNLGVAGSLKHDITHGKIIEIKTVAMDPLPFALPPVISLDECGSEGRRLVTVASPVHDEENRSRLGQNNDLVDMEGYAIAMAAQHCQAKLRMIKIVSDGCNKNDQPLIRERIPGLMLQLRDYWSNLS